ncbi:hypothetical protein GCM10028825_07510 [Spirosoma agri]
MYVIYDKVNVAQIDVILRRDLHLIDIRSSIYPQSHNESLILSKSKEEAKLLFHFHGLPTD